MDPTRNPTILMADDDPAQLILSEAALAGAGFMVHSVGDGADAVEQFDQLQPDIIILDVNMPRMSGIDACRAIRARAGGRVLPVLMLTGRNDLSAISEAFAAGASDFAQKGINPRLLVERVRFLLRDQALQEELRSSRSKLLLAQRIARVGHWELGTEGRTLHVSPMLGEILEVDPSSLRGFEDFVRMLEPSEQFAVRQAFVACASGAGGFGLHHNLRTAAGTAIRVRQEAELVGEVGLGQDGTIIVTLQDVTRLYRAEEAVRTLSYSDASTGLPNRRHLTEQVDAALADRAGVAASGVMAFRIHNIDHVAQAQGFEAANELVAFVAQCLESEVASISDGAMVPWRAASAAICRSAEAELALLLRSRMSEEHLAQVAHGVLRSLEEQLRGEQGAYIPGVSAGIAFAGSEADAEQLLQRAHAAAEQAVEPWSCETYSPAPLARSRRRLKLESVLRGAIERGEISLAYQPRVTLDAYEFTGVECLARLENAELGSVEPAEFIPVAEAAGLMVGIGRWVMGEACRQLAAWRAHFSRDFFVSVNLSSGQLRDPGLVSAVRQAIETNGLPASALELELTESSIVDLPAGVRKVLESLRDLGVRIAIDNFGAGYSSLGQIRRMKFDCMKLDRSLIADLYTDLGAQGVATAVIAMARSLRVRSVAEGVEDVGTLEMLQALGCDEIQGHYVSPPLGARALEDWLDSGGAASLAKQGTLDVIDALEAVERRSLSSRRG
jgi:EAL domain-containing protein (putative c-di-GMP-specific phosphodiesterase class I)/DNA-binding response OmpR family regulator/GGDEF domain-containing protein